MNLRPIVLMLLSAAPAFCLESPPATPKGMIHTDVPARPDPAKRWLIYAHGHIVELQGRAARSPEFGRYEYDAILQAFAERGFEVISEVRPNGSGPTFAPRLVAQVRKLRAAGVPAEQIALVGASRGGFYTLDAVAELQEPKLPFVVLASCGEPTVALAPRLRGRGLSIYDQADQPAVSCRATFDAAKGLQASREVLVTLGKSHGLLYEPYPEWVEPAVAWVRGE